MGAREILNGITAFVSLGIGVIGLLIIVIGCVKAFWSYLSFLHHHEQVARIRVLLSTHMVLGLDFLVGKDIIDTLLLSHGADWGKLGGLAIIIILRIVLNHFLMKELGHINEKKSS